MYSAGTRVTPRLRSPPRGTMVDANEPLAETVSASARREAFVLAYIGGVDGIQKFNGTAAARHAGYEYPSEESVRLLKNARVRARIDSYLESFTLTANETLSELSDIASAEWRDFVTVRTDPRTGETLDVKMDLGSKVKSLELIAKIRGMMTEKIDVSGSLKREYVIVKPDDVT